MKRLMCMSLAVAMVSVSAFSTFAMEDVVLEDKSEVVSLNDSDNESEGCTISEDVTDVYGDDLSEIISDVEIADNSIEEEIVESKASDWTFDDATGTLTCNGKNADESWKSVCSIYEVDKIVLTDKVIKVKKEIFKGCKSLKAIDFSSSVTEIGEYAFANCINLKNVTIPSSVTEIGNCAFEGCNSLESVSILSNAATIGYCAFSGCTSLETISLSNGITEIGDSAFNNCISLKSMTIPNGLKSIEDGIFTGCNSLNSIVIPDSVMNIGASAFEGCSELAQITIPSNMRWIDNCAFGGCIGLRKVTIPSSVNYIGKNIFTGCDNLIEVTNNSACAADLPKVYNLKGIEVKWYEKATGKEITSITNGVAIHENGSFGICFMGNGSDDYMKSQTMKIDVATKLSSNKFTREGYNFIGWNTKEDGSGIAYKNKQVVKNLATTGKSIKLYAQWNKNTYKIKFTSNGGKGKMKNLSMTYGTKMRLTKNTFKKKGYVFKGWATSKKNAKNGIVKYKNKAKVKNLTTKNNKTVTLYAVWKKK